MSFLLAAGRIGKANDVSLVPKGEGPGAPIHVWEGGGDRGHLPIILEMRGW